MVRKTLVRSEYTDVHHEPTILYFLPQVQDVMQTSACDATHHISQCLIGSVPF